MIPLICHELCFGPVGHGVQTVFDIVSRLPGLNVGCFYAVGTLLNRMIIERYPVSPADCVWTCIHTKYRASSVLPSTVLCTLHNPCYTSHRLLISGLEKLVQLLCFASQILFFLSFKSQLTPSKYVFMKWCYSFEGLVEKCDSLCVWCKNSLVNFPTTGLIKIVSTFISTCSFFQTIRSVTLCSIFFDPF